MRAQLIWMGAWMAVSLSAGCAERGKATAAADGAAAGGGGGASDGGGGGPATVDDVLAGRVAAGTTLTLRGTVGAVTFLRTAPAPNDPEQLGQLTDDRVVLLQPSAAPSPPVFGVGAILPGDVLRARAVRLPARGDTVEVIGTLASLRYNDDDQPVLRPVTDLRVITAAGPMLADVGAPCTLDVDCQDDLWCERGSSKCVVPQRQSWNSAVRNINGTCQTDADCPARQRCQLDYTIAATGQYAPHYAVSRDVGRHLCRVDPAAQPAVHCPQPLRPEDVLSGRYPEGKEVCVRARVEFPVVASDRDTHVQLLIEGAAVFPLASPVLEIFHFASEITPIHKDPANPLGAMLDPPAGSMIEALGTVHYDDGHGWWEIHPIKWYRVVGAALGSGPSR